MKDNFKKPHGLVVLKNNLTTNEHKLFNTILKMVIHDIKENPNHENIWLVSYKELKEISGISTNENIIISANGLMDNKIHIKREHLKKDTEFNWANLNTNFISAFQYSNELESIRIEIPTILLELLKDKYIFAQIDLKVMRGLTKKHSLWLYELLVDYINIGHKYYSIEDLRYLSGIGEKQYIQTGDFRLYVISKAVKEINDKKALKVEEIIKKRGRKIIGIDFKFFDKLKNETKDSEDFRKFLISIAQGTLEGRLYFGTEKEFYVGKNNKGKYLLFDIYSKTPMIKTESLKEWIKLYKERVFIFDKWAKEQDFKGIDGMFEKWRKNNNEILFD